MTAKWWRLAALLLASGLTAMLLPLTFADGMPAEAAEKTTTNRAIDLSITAYKMAEFGRENKSPEALVAAAITLRLLRTVKLESVTELPTDDKGKPLADQALEIRTFGDQADDLFDEASALAVQLKLAKFDDYIASAKQRNRNCLIPGIKATKRRINAGQSETFHVKLVADVPASFGFTATAPLQFQISLDGAKSVWVDGVYTNGSFSKKPDGQKGEFAAFSITVHNPGTRAADYILFLK